MNFARPLLVVALTLFLNSCCSEEGKKRAGAFDAGAQVEVTSATQEVSPLADGMPGMKLLVQADPRFSLHAKVEGLTCSGERGSAAIIEVQWTSQIPNLSSIRITAADAGQVAKVWVEAGGTGKEVTGAWVNDGSTLEITDLANGVQLGLIKAQSTRCVQR